MLCYLEVDPLEVHQFGWGYERKSHGKHMFGQKRKMHWSISPDAWSTLGEGSHDHARKRALIGTQSWWLFHLMCSTWLQEAKYLRLKPTCFAEVVCKSGLDENSGPKGSSSPWRDPMSSANNPEETRSLVKGFFRSFPTYVQDHFFLNAMSVLVCHWGETGTGRTQYCSGFWVHQWKLTRRIIYEKLHLRVFSSSGCKNAAEWEQYEIFQRADTDTQNEVKPLTTLFCKTHGTVRLKSSCFPTPNTIIKVLFSIAPSLATTFWNACPMQWQAWWGSADLAHPLIRSLVLCSNSYSQCKQTFNSFQHGCLKESPTRTGYSVNASCILDSGEASACSVLQPETGFFPCAQPHTEETAIV